MVLLLSVCEEGISQLSDVAWRAVEQLKKERGNNIKYNDEGFVTELELADFPGGFLIGQLEVFPHLEVVSIDSRYYFEDSTMGGIRKLTKLKKFELKNSRYATNATLEMLAEAPMLETVLLEQCGEISSLHELSRIRRLKHLTINPQEALTFTPLVECRKLKSVKLINSDTIDDSAIKELARVKSLETIDLSSTSITDEGLAELGKLPNLKKLVLRKCNAITGEAFSEFEHPESIIDLDLRESKKLNDDGIKEFERFVNLEHLRLYKNDDIKGSGFSCIGSFSKLKTLYCPNTAIADNHIKPLDGIETLELIWLPACPEISGRGLECLTKSQGCKKLSVNECRKIDSPDFEILVKFKNLEELYLAETRIRNEDIERLCELKKLNDLNLSGNIWLDDRAFEKLQNCTVKRLLAKNLPRLTDKSFQYATKMKNLANLLVTANPQLTGDGMKALVGNESLKYMTFESPGHLSLNGLAFLKQVPNIEELYFKEGEVAVAQLEQLSGMQNLRTLRYEVENSEKASERLISILKTFPKLK